MQKMNILILVIKVLKQMVKDGIANVLSLVTFKILLVKLMNGKLKKED